MHSILKGALTAGAAMAVMAQPLYAKDITVAPGEDAQERLQEALILAEPGDAVVLGEGRFDLTDGLSLDIDNVTVRGAGPGKSVLSFKGQQGAGEGLLVTSDNVVLRDFAVEDTRGDGIKSKGADNIVYYNVRVEWTGGPKETNGAYGIYPVESENVLIDRAVTKGASDAGIYVGQSRNIIVRGSVAMYNVAGIEIENSYDADVHSNVAMLNTGGVLVFDLPNLPQQGGRNVRVFKNVVMMNDTPNFAPKGNIVASVPAGTGVMVMANSNVEIFDNVLRDNATSNIIITGYRFPLEDENYQPTPQKVRISGNEHGRAGYNPGYRGLDQAAAAMGGSIPPILWDGSGEDIASSDAVPVLTLGLAAPDAPLEQAKPDVVTLEGDAAPVLPVITLPAAMEAAIK